MLSLPAGVYALPGGALAQLLHGNGANVGEIVGARGSNDAIPDDSLVGGGIAGNGGARGGRRRPLGCDIDEELLGVPRK